MKAWNDKANEKIKMMPLPFTTHDEINSKEAGVVLVKILFETGLLIDTADNGWSLPVDVDNKLKFLAGDFLSAFNLRGFTKSLVGESSQVFKKHMKRD